jgi:hypothetical protein
MPAIPAPQMTTSAVLSFIISSPFPVSYIREFNKSGEESPEELSNADCGARNLKR